jgi:polyisoprenyl-phosphate glycosyltransferase
MKESIQLLSIIVPVYNSEELLPELVQRIDDAIKKLGLNYELILVDDGSKDSSWEVIEKLKTQFDATLKAIRFTKNFGQHNAILCGCRLGKGDVYITMDDDLQHPPEEIEKLISTFLTTHADIVYGVSSGKKVDSVRSLGSRFVANSSEHTNKDIKSGSSFRLIKGSIISELRNNQYHNFLFLDAIINWYTAQVATVEVAHHPRKKGKSGYNVFKLAGIYFNMLLNYSALPLKIMTYMGLTISFISFLIGVYFIWRKMNYDVPMGFTSIIVAILFSTGLILGALGIVLQYLYKLYLIQNNKPLYFIQKQLS